MKNDHVVGKIEQLIEDQGVAWSCFHRAENENDKLRKKIEKLEQEIRRLKSGCKK